MRVVLGMIVCAGALCLLSGCSTEQFEPSEINFSRVELLQGRFEQERRLDDMTVPALEDLADAWQRHGDGPMNVNVLYDPRARANGPMTAGRHAARLGEALRLRGVTADAGTLPVSGHGEDLSVFISYPQTTARAPSNCGPMPGLDGTGPDFGKTGLNEGYRAGCGIESILARQVARPSDLRGRSGLQGPSDGRRVYQQIGGYRAGVPNEPLEGEQASDK